MHNILIKSFAVMAGLLTAITSFGQTGSTAIEPTATYLFAQRDSCELFMDYYAPANGSETMRNGRIKPAILFAFGGGFVAGERDNASYKPWFKLLTDNGYSVFSMDYRLGLKGKEFSGLKIINSIKDAIRIGVEDMYSATAFIAENADQLGIAADNIVISGSSAGAIISLQSEYELCNHSDLASLLPEDFRFSGIMAFSGAIFSTKGKVKFEEEPAPILLLHGTKDKVVTYKQIKVFNLGLFGAHKLTKRLKKFGYNYNTLRYVDHGHDIAGSMAYTFPEQLRFLETNVNDGVKRIVDTSIDDPSVPIGHGARNVKELYKD